MSLRIMLLLLIPLLGLTLTSGGCRDGGIELDALSEGDELHGFRLLNLYEDAAGNTMGGRLIDERSGFLVDLLSIQSVPQGFFWVKTLAHTDQGEPHACEHLLLGKGKTGRAVASQEEMSMGSSSAWTSQLNTVYHFNTLAGEEAFIASLEGRLNALINPDFLDEEIRREVSHVAVGEDAETGALYLEEKGTVFTEMVSSYEGPGYPLWNGIGEMLFGDDHPQSNSSGGLPDAMRDMTAEELWSFHREFYRPSGMGIIASLPGDMNPGAFLADLAQVMRRVWPEDHGRGDGPYDRLPGIMAHELPAPQSAVETGTLVVKPYAAENPASPGRALLSWPARLELDVDEMGKLELFLDAFAGGAGTPLYDALVASETRVLETGAGSVWGYHSDEPGHPVMFGINGIDPDKVSVETLAALRDVITGRLRALRDWPADSEELAAFNREAASRLASDRKGARQALDRPPMFGFRRGSAGYWQNLLGTLERQPGFRKSLVLADHYDRLEAMLASEGNAWAEAIDRWGLLEEKPLGIGVYPSPEMLDENRRSREAHLETALAELKKQYEGRGDEQAVLAAYRAEFDATTAELEAEASGDPIPEFVANPPLSLDDPLDYAELTLPGGGPLVASTFENMSSATLGLAFRLDMVPEERLHLLPLLPGLLTRAGLTLEGETLDYVTMQERRRRELTSFTAYFDSNMEAGRIELVLRGTAAGAEEMDRLPVWMRAALSDPYLAEENLPRLRDMADQTLTGLRSRMQGSEESWVQDPAAAYRYQADPLFLSTSSFLTQAHHWLRLKWLLSEPASTKDSRSLSAYLGRLAAEGEQGREALAERLAEEPMPGASGGARELAKEIAASLGALLPDLPEASLAADWRGLCMTVERDLHTPPGFTLSALDEILAGLRHGDNVRGFIISSSADRAALLPAVEEWVATFSPEPSTRVGYEGTPRVLARLKARRGLNDAPVYVGLLNENTRNGTLIFTSRNAEAWNPDRESVLDALAGNVYAGGGAHGLFMRTWAAGLAYSNGYRYRERSGMASYYAERCPDVAQTMRFITGVLDGAQVDDALVRYAVAVAFGASRAAGPYETRGEAMAANLVDGVHPDRVRAFRRKVLELSQEPGLAEELAGRIGKVYGQVMVGLGDPLARSRDGVFFLIGPEPQFESFEELVATSEKPREVERLHPRDFWLIN